MSAMRESATPARRLHTPEQVTTEFWRGIRYAFLFSAVLWAWIGVLVWAVTR